MNRQNDTNLWSMKRNFPSIVCLDKKCKFLKTLVVAVVFMFVISWLDDFGTELLFKTFGGALPAATKQDRLQEYPSPYDSRSFNPIFDCVHVFKWPVQWITMYFLSELVCRLQRAFLLNILALSFDDAVDLYFIRQKKERRAPGHNSDRSCSTSVFNGSIARNSLNVQTINAIWNCRNSTTHFGLISDVSKKRTIHKALRLKNVESNVNRLAVCSVRIDWLE